MYKRRLLLAIIWLLSAIMTVHLSCTDKGQEPVNGAPQINSAASANALIGENFSYTASATDPDGSAPIVHFENFAGWMDTAGMVISGIPTAETPDTSFAIIATDSLLADTLIVLVDVVSQVPAVSFSNDVRPIFNTHCINCHVGGSQGGLRLDNYTLIMAGGGSGAVVTAGDAQSSLLVKRIEGRVLPRMPLDLQALSSADIDLIRTWIDEGANDN